MIESVWARSVASAIREQVAAATIRFFSAGKWCIINIVFALNEGKIDHQLQMIYNGLSSVYN